MTIEDIKVGLKFHIKKSYMVVEVLAVAIPFNLLRVKITSKSASTWTEIWNLYDTVISFKQGQYTLLEPAKAVRDLKVIKLDNEFLLCFMEDNTCKASLSLSSFDLFEDFGRVCSA